MDTPMIAQDQPIIVTVHTWQRGMGMRKEIGNEHSWTRHILSKFDETCAVKNERIKTNQVTQWDNEQKSKNKQK